MPHGSDHQLSAGERFEIRTWLEECARITDLPPKSDGSRIDAAETAEERAWVERIASNGSRRRACADSARSAGRCSLIPDFLADVSAEDLRLRFFADIAEFSAAEGKKLARLDRHNIVFVGLDEETGQMLGLVRLKEELDEVTAEFAIMVRSRLKGHGLGWMLMQRALEYGKENGLRRIYGDVLAETRACCKCAKSLASASTTWDRA